MRGGWIGFASKVGWVRVGMGPQYGLKLVGNSWFMCWVCVGGFPNDEA
jgi:hypothetical protein